MPDAQMPIKVFCSYASADEQWCRELETYLYPLIREGTLTFQARYQVMPGMDVTQAVYSYVTTASIVLLLLSPEYFASDICMTEELQLALERFRRHKISIIPILLHPLGWIEPSLARLQVLPSTGQPIALWKHRDAAWANVVSGLRRVIDRHAIQSTSVSPRFPFWNVPYSQNLFFTGRDLLLEQLASAFHKGQAIALSQTLGISGLGGVGKTQMAVEYAHRYAQNYQAVLWTRADSLEALITGFVEIARTLELPEHREQNQFLAVEATKRWLAHESNWLLILDNADQLELIRDFLPTSMKGHVIITTRSQSMKGLATKLEVAPLDRDMGILLLLRRSGMIHWNATLEQATEEDRRYAKTLYEELGGLPLALDQVGAYIEETQCTLQDYLNLYYLHRGELLQRRGGIGKDHPDAVATTWSLSFAAIKRQSDIAADLLQLCAFLHPDAIPEELILQGAGALESKLQTLNNNQLEFNRILTIIMNYSLIRRNSAERTLSIHRLVQTVLQETLNEQERARWQQQTINALNAVFPEVSHDVWIQCERLYPHVLLCTEALKDDLGNQRLIDILEKAARYGLERARYEEAEPLYRQALRIYEQTPGFENLQVAASLNGLARLCREQGRYEEAEPLYRQALHICEQISGSENLQAAISLNGLARLYREQGRYEEAEPLYRQALHICEQVPGSENLQAATSLNGLAILYSDQGEYNKAEPLFHHALTIWEQTLGIQHPQVASALNGLAILHRELGNHKEAESFYQRALQIREKALGAEHPQVAYPLTGLASLYSEQGKYEEAESFYRRALQIREKALGPEHPDIAYPLTGLASLYSEQGKYEEAESFYRRALQIREKALGPEHPDVAYPLTGLASLYSEQGKYEEAESFYQRALQIREKALGPEHIKTIKTRTSYTFLRSQEKLPKDTEKLESEKME